MSFLLDTNVVSEGQRARGAVQVKAWLAGVPGPDLFLSVMTLGEIRQGVERLRRRDPQQSSVYEAWLGQLEAEFADRVLPITAAVADEWGRLNAGDPLPIIDALLAATARVHGLTIVTRNTRDLARTGVTLLNPWVVAK